MVGRLGLPVGGSIRGFEITNPGEHYRVGDTVTFVKNPPLFRIVNPGRAPCAVHTTTGCLVYTEPLFIMDMERVIQDLDFPDCEIEVMSAVPETIRVNSPRAPRDGVSCDPADIYIHRPELHPDTSGQLYCAASTHSQARYFDIGVVANDVFRVHVGTDTQWTVCPIHSPAKGVVKRVTRFGGIEEIVGVNHLMSSEKEPGEICHDPWVSNEHACDLDHAASTSSWLPYDHDTSDCFGQSRKVHCYTNTNTNTMPEASGSNGLTIGAQGTGYGLSDTGWLLPTAQTVSSPATPSPTAPSLTPEELVTFPRYTVTGVSREGGITTFSVTYPEGYITERGNVAVTSGSVYYFRPDNGRSVGYVCNPGRCQYLAYTPDSSTASAFVTHSGVLNRFEKCPIDSFGIRVLLRLPLDLTLTFSIPDTVSAVSVSRKSAMTAFFRFVIDPRMGVAEGNVFAARFDRRIDTGNFGAATKNYFLHGYGMYNLGDPIGDSKGFFLKVGQVWKYAFQRPGRRPIIDIELGFNSGEVSFDNFPADLSAGVRISLSNLAGATKAPCHSFCDGIW